MRDIQDLHDEVFQMLYDHHRDLDENLMFTTRKTNRYNRLEEGYWFHGNDDYLAVSFWSGMDWKNKTPNIFFGITKNGRTYLEISVSDSDEKNRLVLKYLVDELNLEEKNSNRYGKEYNQEFNFSYLDSLRQFIEPGGDWHLIDSTIRQNSSEFSQSDSHGGIGVLDSHDFDRRLAFVLKFRQIKDQTELERPTKIKSVTIKGFGPIQNLTIKNVSSQNQWIFLTGMNGTGKSTILKALGPALSQKKVDTEQYCPEENYDVSFNLFDQFDEVHSRVRINNNSVSSRRPNLIKGFCAYGPVRLQTARMNITDWQLKRALNKAKILDSLMEENESYLLDFSAQLKHWRQKIKHKKHVEERKDQMREILRDIFDLRFDVDFDDEDNVIYIEKDERGREISRVPYRDLSTGLRSTISLIGDILIRLYEQQPNETDPSSLFGVVLIDEIDIHLHPKLQKKIVEELTNTFPRVQFIVTTHSPIPLLGAPKESLFYVVKRAAEQGVLVDLLDMDISDLLPNTILSSPIFGFDEIISNEHNSENLLRTENDYQEAVFNKILDKKIENRLKGLGLK